MATFIVSYDLKAPGRNYQPVWDYLKSAGTHWHALDSVWLIESSLNAGGIRDGLKNLIDANDRVMVIRVDGQNWATSHMDNIKNVVTADYVAQRFPDFLTAHTRASVTRMYPDILAAVPVG